jgi:hypothetical protein
MSKTGIYKVINGKVEKVSDTVPSLNVTFGVRFTEPYYSETLGCYINNKEQKYNRMKELKLVEYDKANISRQTTKVDHTKAIETTVRQALEGRRL